MSAATRSKVRSAAVCFVAAGALAGGAAWAAPEVAPPTPAAPYVEHTAAGGGKVRLGPAAFTVACIYLRTGAIRCTVPGLYEGWRKARVQCRIYEDGSGRCVVLDPDKRKPGKRGRFGGGKLPAGGVG